MYSSRSSKTGKPIDWYAAHNTSLAAFLMGMSNQSYFGSGMHWADWGWGTDWPAFAKKLGRPRGPAVRAPDGFSFEREFEYLTVRLNCTALKTKFDWRDEQQQSRTTGRETA